MRLIVAAALFLLAACRPSFSPPGPPTTPTAPPLMGSVDIEFPPDGAVLYAEVASISGTAFSIPEGRFTLKLVGPELEVIAQAEVTANDGPWHIDLLHGYSSEPVEVTLSAEPADSRNTGEYDVVTIALASRDFRPEGSYSTILAPAENDSVGGESFLTAGTASGIFNNALSLELIAEDERIITQRVIMLQNPHHIDDIPWQTEIETHGYTGPAVLRVFGINATGQEEGATALNLQIGIEAG